MAELRFALFTADSETALPKVRLGQTDGKFFLNWNLARELEWSSTIELETLQFITIIWLVPKCSDDDKRFASGTPSHTGIFSIGVHCGEFLSDEFIA
jgi:hypothetical protein